MPESQDSHSESVQHTAHALPDESSFSSDRYRIERTLGSGGMAYVLLATDSVLDRKVAIKVPQSRTVEGSDVIEKRFLREAQAAAALSHPNICPIYDIGHSEGMFFIAMGYVEGCLLSQLIQETEQFEEAEVAQVIHKIASGAAEAHRQGILHRDLKSSNIMIDRRGEPIILDFGLARFFSDSEVDETLTREGQALGTPAYMSPEQATGKRDLTPATDVFSLGVVMWEMLCGERPFQGDTLVLMGQIVHGSAPSPRTKRPGISREMEAICLKALAKDPQDRFESMQQFQHALEDVLEGREVSIDLARFTSDGPVHDTLDLRRTPTPQPPPPPDDDTAVDHAVISRIIRHPLFWVWSAIGLVIVLLLFIIVENRFHSSSPNAAVSNGGAPGFGPGPGPGAGRAPGPGPGAGEHPMIRPPRRGMTVDEVFTAYDLDGNGRLDSQEFLMHIIERADTNGDGELDRQELEQGLLAQGDRLMGPPAGQEGPPGEGRFPGGGQRDQGPPNGGPGGFGPGPNRPPPGGGRRRPGGRGGPGQRPGQPPPGGFDGPEGGGERPPRPQ